MGFFKTLSTIFEVILAFFPRWFITGFCAVLVAVGVWALIQLVIKLKNLFWPF